MISFIAMVAVAAWLLVMIPAAFVLFVGNPVDADDRTAQPAIALVPHPDRDTQLDRNAA